MKVWVDDIREMPKSFNVHTKTTKETIKLLMTGKVIAISLDHDLGDLKCGTGYDIAEFIERNAYFGILPKLQWFIHSANPVGRQKMLLALGRADRYWEMNS